MLMFPAGYGIRIRGVRFAVMTFDFLQDLVGTADVFVLDIKNRVDEMLMLQQPEAILRAKPGKKSAVVEIGLAVEIKLRGPPRSSSIFELHPKSMEVVAAALRAKRGEVFDLEAARLLHVVIVGNNVRILLSPGGKGKKHKK